MERLKELRILRNLSQQELAVLSGINLRSLQQYETGRRKIDNAHIGTLLDLAEALSIPFYELISNSAICQKLQKNLNETRKNNMKKTIFETVQNRFEGDSFSDFFFAENKAFSKAEDILYHLTPSEKKCCGVYVQSFTVTLPDNYIPVDAENLINDLCNGDVEAPEFDVTIGSVPNPNLVKKFC